MKSKAAAEELNGQHEAEVISARSEPIAGFKLVKWRLGLKITQGESGEIQVIAPPALPLPVMTGDRVRAVVFCTLGGPNGSCSVVIEAHDGSLLLAIDREPKGWQVKEGKSLGTKQEGAYRTREFGVAFQHGATRVESEHTWARAEIDGVPYYLWGGGVERKTPPGTRHPPDYVGGWMDYAIVRAR